MDCTTARVAISARLDGELQARERSQLDAHLVQCASCAAWQELAHTVTRRARIALAPVAPSAPPGLAARMRHTRGWRSHPTATTRLALVAVALLQLAVTVPQLLMGSDHLAPLHVAREMGAFDAALAVGFLLAAWHPENARGMHVLVGAVALLLVATACVDIATGHTTPAAEAPHLLAVAGWMLLRVLALHELDEIPDASARAPRLATALVGARQAEERPGLADFERPTRAREAVG